MTRCHIFLFVFGAEGVSATSMRGDARRRYCERRSLLEVNRKGTLTLISRFCLSRRVFDLYVRFVATLWRGDIRDNSRLFVGFEHHLLLALVHLSRRRVL
jgi:hypothetical protein